MARGWSRWTKNPGKHGLGWVIFDVDKLEQLADEGAYPLTCWARRAGGSTPAAPAADDAMSEGPLLYFSGMPRSRARWRVSACIWLISFTARLLFWIHLRQIFACSWSR